jgi:hypothetical protein
VSRKDVLVLRPIVLTAALFASLLVGGATARGVAEPLARWERYTVAGAGQGAWSVWYKSAYWPVRYRFKCENGAVVVNAANTDRLAQAVSARAWDVRADEDKIERAIATNQVNRPGFSLAAGQSTSLQIYRPSLCSAASNNFAFAVLYGS